MTDSFDADVWDSRFRDGLVRIREAVWAARSKRTHHEDEDEQQRVERIRLREVADHPAFASLGPDVERVARGKWIVQRALEAVGRERRALPPTASTGPGRPADKAVLLWAQALERGSRPAELARELPDLLPARGEEGTSAAAAQSRVLAHMWLPGNRRRKESGEGIARIYNAMVAALQVPDDGAPTLDDITFDYEWRRLAAERPPEQLQLLALLGFVAPAALPLELLREGWEGLPPPLRRAAREGAPLDVLSEDLKARGLVAVEKDGLVCSEETQARVRTRLKGPAERAGCASAVSLLRTALPPDTHFHRSWPSWQLAASHVEAAVQHARRLRVRLEDGAHLLDRLSVYRRDADQNVRAAIAASEEAIELAEQTGQPDPEEFGIYLGNYGMALLAARRLAEAVEVMDRSLDITRGSLGTEHEEYAGTLSIKANFLEEWKRYAEAGAAHRQALEIIRKVATRRPEPAVMGVLVEILSDYATFLLRVESGLEADAETRALALLDEALEHVGRDEHGWRQIVTSRARALWQVGRLEEAEVLFRDLVSYCAQTYGDHSRELRLVLSGLCDVLQDRGSPEWEPVLLRLREIDDAIERVAVDPTGETS